MLVFDPLAVLLLIAGNISLGVRNVGYAYDDKTNEVEKKKDAETASSTEDKIIPVDPQNIHTMENTQVLPEQVIEEIHHAEGLFTTQTKE